MANPACCVEYDAGIGGEQAIRTNATRLIQAASIEIGRVQRDAVFVRFGLARNLAKDDGVAAQGRKNQCRTPFGLGQIGEGKV
jgi:hypothetical protein